MPLYNFYSDASMMFRHLSDETPKNADFQMHIHDQFELLYFVRGTAECIVETTSYQLLPDTLMAMRPMESHRINILASSPYERYTLNFSTELLDAIAPEKKLLSPFFDRSLGEKNLYHASEFEIHPQKLFSAMASPQFSEGERRTAILINFYALLGQLFSAFSVKKSEAFGAEKSPALETANYINEHLFEELSVRSLSDKFYVSVSQLNRLFKKATGFSIWEYIVNKRLAAARNLIKENTPATRACAECGFNDYSSFYRLYLKKFGVSPKEDISKAKK